MGSDHGTREKGPLQKMMRDYRGLEKRGGRKVFLLVAPLDRDVPTDGVIDAPHCLFGFGGLAAAAVGGGGGGGREVTPQPRWVWSWVLPFCRLCGECFSLSGRCSFVTPCVRVFVCRIRCASSAAAGLTPAKKGGWDSCVGAIVRLTSTLLSRKKKHPVEKGKRTSDVAKGNSREGETRFKRQQGAGEHFQGWGTGSEGDSSKACLCAFAHVRIHPVVCALRASFV